MSANSLEARFARAELLYQQSRHEMAAHELRQILAVAPENPPAHALLSLCLVEQKQFDEAQREAEVAVVLEIESVEFRELAGIVRDGRGGGVGEFLG